MFAWVFKIVDIVPRRVDVVQMEEWSLPKAETCSLDPIPSFTSIVSLKYLLPILLNGRAKKMEEKSARICPFRKIFFIS